MKIKHILQKINKFPVFFMLLAGLGLAGSMMIAIEKEHLLKDPNAELSCSVNPVYSCQSVITSDQASVLGFSNEYLGIAMFGGFLALGVAMLAGAKFHKWLYKLIWLGLAGSMLTVIWFFYQSVYVIDALCIYCTTVWFASWTLFVGYSRWLLANKVISVPKRYESLKQTLVKNAAVIWLLLIVIFAGLILNHFWYYYGQYF